MTLPGPFEAAVAELLDPALKPHGFVRQPLQQHAAEWWVTYLGSASEIVVHYEVGSGAWLTLGQSGGPSQAVTRIANARAKSLGHSLPPQPTDDLRAILAFNADLLIRYCAPELEGRLS